MRFLTGLVGGYLIAVVVLVLTFAPPNGGVWALGFGLIVGFLNVQRRERSWREFLWRWWDDRNLPPDA